MNNNYGGLSPIHSVLNRGEISLSGAREMNLWLILGELLVAFVGGMIAAGVLVAIGGMGAIRRAQSSADQANSEVALVSERLTRHQKRVASVQGVEARAATLSVKEQAEAHLAGAEREDKPRRPSVIRMLRS